MPYGTPFIPASTAGFIPSHKATGMLIAGYSRNPDKFPHTKYVEIRETKKPVSIYARWTSQQAARIVGDFGEEFAWSPGADAPSGAGNLESWVYVPFTTRRWAFPFTIDTRTTDAADFNIVAAYSQVTAQQAMTHRTKLILQSLLNGDTSTGQIKNWNDVGHYAAKPSDLVGAAAAWDKGSSGVPNATEPGANIKKTLNRVARKINIDTLATVQPNQLNLVINPNTAMKMAESSEINWYVSQSPFALAQLRGDAPNQNGQWGLPDRLYNYNVIVEDSVLNPNIKGSTALSQNYILGDGQALVLTRTGELEGIGESPSFTTCQVYWFQDEMTVETMNDPINRRVQGRVVMDYAPIVVSELSGFVIGNVFDNS